MIIPTTQQSDTTTLLYDGSEFDSIESDWFEPLYWQQQGATSGQAVGRGTTWFIDYQEQHWALRHYQRGGLITRWNHDRYFGRWPKRSRAWREWHLLAKLYTQNLPVPKPIAARIQQQGWFYTADLITQRIMDAEPLARILRRAALPDERWRQIGATIERFHAAGVYHADLNANNILLTVEQVYLLDFDRGKQSIYLAKAWREQNLQRLQRSLQKLRLLQPGFAYNSANWQTLLHGYKLEI